MFQSRASACWLPRLLLTALVAHVVAPWPHDYEHIRDSAAAPSWSVSNDAAADRDIDKSIPAALGQRRARSGGTQRVQVETAVHLSNEGTLREQDEEANKRSDVSREPQRHKSVMQRYEKELAVSVGFLAAGFIHAAAGFGAGMTSMAILPFRLPLTDATPVVAVFSFLVMLTMSMQLRNALSRPRVRAVLPPLVIGAAAGVPLGGVLLTAADPRVLKIILGVCMLIFVFERMLHELGCTEESGHQKADDDGVEFTSLAGSETTREEEAHANDPTVRIAALRYVHT